MIPVSNLQNKIYSEKSSLFIPDAPMLHLLPLIDRFYCGKIYVM